MLRSIPEYGFGKIKALYGLLLFDASAILSPFLDSTLGGRTDPEALVKKEHSSMLSQEYVRHLQNCLTCDEPFFVTKMVLDEINTGRSNISKKTKAALKHYINSPNRVSTLGREQDRLVSYFHNYEKIVSLDEDESRGYRLMREVFEPFLMEGLSKPDIDFLVTGFLLSLRNRVALISNDRDIFRSYESILENRLFDLTPKNIGFYKGFGGRNYFMSLN